MCTKKKKSIQLAIGKNRMRDKKRERDEDERDTDRDEYIFPKSIIKMDGTRAYNYLPKFQGMRYAIYTKRKREIESMGLKVERGRAN